MPGLCDHLRYYTRFLLYQTPVRALLNALRLQRAHHDPAYWDKMLSGQFLDYVDNILLNDCRYLVVQAIAKHYVPNPVSILDVGCGGGYLSQNMAAIGFKHYRGLDISPYAIAQADPHFGSFQACDFRHFSPPQGEHYDLIVFNEMLYYAEVAQAVEQVMRYCQFLTPTGLICVSMKDDPKSHAIYQALHHRLAWVYGLQLQPGLSRPRWRPMINRAQPNFLISLLQPANRPTRQGELPSRLRSSPMPAPVATADPGPLKEIKV